MAEEERDEDDDEDASDEHHGRLYCRTAMSPAQRLFWSASLEFLKAVVRLLPKVIKGLEDWLAEDASLQKSA